MPLNLHMLRPREVVDAALRQHDVPLNSLEGFIRQIIGWREFVRGIYWRLMPDYAECNVLGADLPMPRFFWTGETDMRCLHEAIRHTIHHGYAHHIERLMVLGQFCLSVGCPAVRRASLAHFDVRRRDRLGVAAEHARHEPARRWRCYRYEALRGIRQLYQPNERSLPACRYDPHKSVGEDACPFTTLYWDFLARHAKRFRKQSAHDLPLSQPGTKRSARGRPDVVLLAMKTQDTGSRARLNSPRTVRAGRLRTKRSRNERLAARRFEHVYAMLVALPATFLEPGVVIASAAPLYPVAFTPAAIRAVSMRR